MQDLKSNQNEVNYNIKFITENFSFNLIQIIISCPNCMQKLNQQPTSKLQYIKHQIQGQCRLASVHILQTNNCKYLTYIILNIFLLALPLLITNWFPTLIKYLYDQINHIQKADHIFIINQDETSDIVELQQRRVFDGRQHMQVLCVDYRYLRYVISDGKIFPFIFQYDDMISNFQNGKIKCWEHDFGKCGLTIKKPSIPSIFKQEIMRPLYIFLIFSSTTQILQNYIFFSVLILVLALIGIISTIIQVIDANNKISEMAYHQQNLYTVRDNQLFEINSNDILPGDIVFINGAITLPFDGVVLGGQIMVNQCALTGESVPVNKKSLMLMSGQILRDSHQLYSGTAIVQINNRKSIIYSQFTQKYGIPILVIRTGFHTLKGRLIRKILYPKQVQNKFQKQSSKFLIFMFAIAVSSFILMLFIHGQQLPLKLILLKFVDIISIAVPPTLPLSMTIGIISAIQFLKDKGIYTTSPSKIINGGLLDSLCFDKTGTLTEDHMDFRFVCWSENGRFRQLINKLSLQKMQLDRQSSLLFILQNMAANHSVIQLQSSGELVGDPMQIDMLKFAQITLKTNKDPYSLFTFKSTYNFQGKAIYKYDFDSTVQRMSTICYSQQNHHYCLYVKGSPQIMLGLMKKQTIPDYYWQKLRQFTSAGYRVLSIGHRILQNQNKRKRQQIQCELEFDGFQIFQNKLKPQTKQAIQTLRSVNIDPVMITGDNAITACHIAYQCNLIDRLHQTLIIYQENGNFYKDIFSFNQLTEQNEELSAKIANITALPQNNQKSIINLALLSHQLLFEQKANHLCITGNVFNHIYSPYLEHINLLPDELSALFLKIKVFARTKPDDKASIIKIYQKIGKIVGMCGDGANDCAALNLADVGLSLSQSQASVAASFTSSRTHIGSMIQLIKQCRAGLATNFSLFNITVIYAFIEYSAVMILQFYSAYPCEDHFIYWDLCLNMFFVLIVGRIATADHLSIQKPSSNLLSFKNIISLLTIFLLQFIGQLLSIYSIQTIFAEDVEYNIIGGVSNNLIRYKQSSDELLYDTVEGSAVFIAANFFYLFSIIAFTITRPWKKPIYTYIPFVLLLIVLLGYSMIIGVDERASLPGFNLNTIYKGNASKFIVGLGLSIGLTMVLIHQMLFNKVLKSY